MSRERYDAIVVGVGGMGSAALYHLASRGRRVLGLERFDVPNEQGSSHGVTRIIRLAYYEHVDYVPLLRRAYELWRELEAAAGEQLLHVTGSIDAGPPGQMVFAGSLRSCEEHGLPHEVLDAARGGAALPRPTGWSRTRWRCSSPTAGSCSPSAASSRTSRRRRRRGAEVRARERVLGWEPAGRRACACGQTRGEYEAERLVLTAGAWIGGAGGAAGGEPERQVLAWLQPRARSCSTPERFPVFNVLADEEAATTAFRSSAFPASSSAATTTSGSAAPADAARPRAAGRDEQLLRAFAERYFPDGAGPVMTLKTCLFTNSPDEHFILDLHPDAPQVVVGGGLLGPRLQVLLASSARSSPTSRPSGATEHEVGFLRLDRLQNAP